MSKGSKEALTVLIVTHVTHVKRVESLLCIKWPLAPQNMPYVCQSMLKGLKVKITFDPFNIHSIGWYGWKGLSLSFPKLFQIENWLNIKKKSYEQKCVCPLFQHNIIFRPF